MVMLCQDQKLMFVMVPATGSSALGKVLMDNLEGKWFPAQNSYKNGKRIPHKHTSLQELLEYELMTQEELSQYLKFATVRNPFDRFTSLYQRRIGEWSQVRMEKDKEKLTLGTVKPKKKDFLQDSIEKREKRMEKAKELGFDAWLEFFLGNYIKKSHEQKMSILYPLIDGVDQTIRCESLEQEFNELIKDAKIIGSDEWVDIPKKNPTQGKKKYQDYYSEKSRAFVEENFSEELAVFGYKFE